MKRLLALSMLLLFSFAGLGQFKKLAEGPEFDEPEDGFAKIIQLKNGNTLFLRIAVRKGIEVRLYDGAHHQKAVKNLDPQYSAIKNKEVIGAFEINGNAVLMIGEIDDKTPVLYRIVIDGQTGGLKSDEKIIQLVKYNYGRELAVAFGHVPPADFYVRKDPFSDYYAVAILNSFESDRNRRIEVIYFGPDNKEISRAYYASPDNKYKYLLYLDMAVIGKEKLSILAEAYNTQASGGKESELVLASLDAGSSTMSLDELPFSKDLTMRDGLARYNPVTRQILLLAVAQVDGKPHEYGTILAHIDPYAHKMVDALPLFPQKVNEKCQEIFGKHNGFSGVPQNVFVNADGGFTLAYEEIVNVTQRGSDYTEQYNDLGNIAVCQYDASGKELNAYLIPKNQRLYGYHLKPFYHSRREGTATELFRANQYKSFAYLNGKETSYILFNDLERNGLTAQKGKITTIQGIAECDGFYFPLTGADMLPSRQFVFARPESRREHELAIFSISDYDRERNVYVTLKLNKEGRSKEVNLIWMQPG
jgi:hypothetical protein